MPPGTRVTSVKRTRQILQRRRPRFLAAGTSPNAGITAVTSAAPMQFTYEQNAPVYGVDDLRAEFNRWGRDVAQKISAGRRN